MDGFYVDKLHLSKEKYLGLDSKVKTHFDLIMEDKSLSESQKIKGFDIAQKVYGELPSCKSLWNTPVYSYAMCQKYQITYERTLRILYEMEALK